MSTIGDAREMVRMTDVPAMPLGPEPAGAGGDEGGMNVADIMRMLKERKALMIVMFLVLYALVVVLTLVVWRWFPTYRAEALLQLKPPQETAFQVSESLVSPAIMSMLIQTEAARIKRPDVLQEVLGLKEIQDTSFYKYYDNFDECADDLERLIRVSPIPDTELIQVSLDCQERDEAQLIVRTLVERYAQRYRQDSEYRGQQSLEDLKTTRDSVRKQLSDKQAELSKFRAQTDVGALESEGMMLVQSITDQTYLVNTYDARAAELQAQLNVVRGIDPTDLPITPEDRVIVEADPLLRMYRQQVEALDVEIGVMQTHMAGAKHKQMKMLLDRRDRYYQLEVSRREELLDDLRERRVQAIKEELTRVRSVQARVQEQLSDLQARQQTLDAQRVRYEAITSDEGRIQKNLETIDQNVMEFQHLVATTPKTARLSIVQLPKKAVWPSRPKFVVYLGGGLMLALGGAVGIVFLRELTDKFIRTPIDVARHGRLSVLGCIPELDDEEADVDEIELATRQAPQSLVAEAFRQVRANLVFSGPVESQHSLLITSPGPGNGKTAVAINLAVTLAQANERVLLIDCNFRRPAIRKAFANTRAEGLSNILIGQGALADLVTQTDTPNLDVLASGPMPPTPAELLGSNYMTELVKEAESKYDRVIFDGPPVLLVSDALVAATQVGAVIMVTRASDNTKGVLKRAREQLYRISAHVPGAILNGVRARPGGYYRQQYREFYEYGADETIPPELLGMPTGPADELPPDSDDRADGQT